MWTGSWRGASLPAVHCQGALEQGTEPPTALGHLLHVQGNLCVFQCAQSEKKIFPLAGSIKLILILMSVEIHMGIYVVKTLFMSQCSQLLPKMHCVKFFGI